VVSSIGLKVVRLLGLSAAVLACSACKRTGAAQGTDGERLRAASTAVLSAAADDSPAPATSRAPHKTVAAGQRIAIPAGTVISGSMPGDRGRDPTLELPLTAIELGAFEIDRLPYPNDPTQPLRTDVTRSQAQQLCTERGQRLCTELEWERACKGPDHDVFPTGSGWDPGCEKNPNSCASGFDVAAMSAALREWTSSSVEPVDKDERAAGALRGGRANAADYEHRCARREPADPGAHGSDIGVRCCSGPANAASIARPKPLQTFKRVQLDLDQVNNMMQSIGQLASLGKISLFRDPEDVTLVLSKGDAGRGANLVTTQPLLWSPDLGEEILVVAGKGSAGSSFIAAFHRLKDDRYRLASSFVLENETPAVVLAFNGYVKNRITWSTCWGCLGEEGAITYRPDRRVVIEQF
jgi:formylglycine-generating enzyme required for sulfatase activity